ncbi:MAG: FAD-dependent oxidoreductase, partial [Terriglobales bacterium]
MAGGNGTGEVRVGAYVCHCGRNIAGTIDVRAVAEHAAHFPGVAVAREYKYMCSDPGQELIKRDIRDYKLNRIVVAACSPSLHEKTFRQVLAEADLNPFLFQMVNIREHNSWVHDDKHAATAKAIDQLRAAVRRVHFHEPLERRSITIKPDVLIVGGGIAGIHAALTIADSGRHVYLVEREPTIGGHMAQFDKTFPTLDCAACILTPKMSAVRMHPNITLWTLSDVAKVEGYVGNYTVTVRHRPRYINEELCVGCMECIEACVYKQAKVSDEFNVGLSKR